MEDKVLQKAMKAAVKVFNDAGYTVTSKILAEDGSVVDMKIIAEQPSESSVDVVYQTIG